MEIAEQLRDVLDHAKEYGNEVKEIVVGEGFAEQAKQAARELGITIPIRVARPMHVATMNEYLKQPFKDATIGDYWYTFDRKTRREIERLVKKGKNPDTPSIPSRTCTLAGCSLPMMSPHGASVPCGRN